MNWSPSYLELPDEVKQFSSAQYRQAYGLIDAARYPSGLYADAYHAGRPAGTDGPIAATGVGLIGLAIAHVEGWDPDARPKLRQTLEAVTAAEAGPGGPVARDPASGFFYHFYDGTTGAAWPGSEVSTVDTSILVAGALFASRLVGPADPAVTRLAEKLLHSIDWSLAVTPDGRAVYMCIEEGRGTNRTGPLAICVGFLAGARGAPTGLTSPPFGTKYHPDRVHALRYVEYKGLRLFGQVRPDARRVSAFLRHQFPLYLIPPMPKTPLPRDFADHCAPTG